MTNTSFKEEENKPKHQKYKELNSINGDRQSSSNQQFTNKTNLFIASSLSLLLLATHSSFDSAINPLSTNFIPRWSALIGILVGAVIIKCCLISFLSYKTSFIVCIAGFILSLLFHFYPAIVPLTISGFIEGICWLLLAVTLASYVTHLAFEHSEETKTSRHDATSKYLALPYFFYKLAELMVQIFDKMLHNNEDKSYAMNTSNITATNNCKLQLFFPQTIDNLTDFEMHFKLSTDQYSINNVIIGISGGTCSMAIAGIYHFLENKHDVYHAENKTRSLKYNLISSLYLFKDKQLLSMLPLIMYLGMAKAYIYSKGINYTIYCSDTNLVHLFITYTSICCLSSITYHIIGDRINSFVMVMIALFIHFVLLMLDFLEIQSPIFIQFIIAAILGLTEVILYCHVKGAFGALYESKKEASYTIFEVLQKIGFYAFHVMLAVFHVNESNIALMVFLLISTICYSYSTRVIRRKGTLHKFEIPYFL